MNKNYLFGGIMALALLGVTGNVYGADTEAEKKTDEAQVAMIDFSKTGYKEWKAATGEASVTIKEEADVPIMIFKVVVDHTKDGKGNTESKYLKGWPRIYRYIKPLVALTKYKEFIFEYKVSSNIKDAEKNPIYAYFKSGKVRCTMSFDAGKEDGQWHTKVIKIEDVIKHSQKSADDWKQLSMLQFGLAESNYADKTEITVELKNLQLQ
jgi:hypothetical protein